MYTGDGFDYNVWVIFEGQKVCIDHVKAFTDRKALNVARKVYGPTVTVSKV